MTPELAEFLNSLGGALIGGAFAAGAAYALVRAKLDAQAERLQGIEDRLDTLDDRLYQFITRDSA